MKPWSLLGIVFSLVFLLASGVQAQPATSAEESAALFPEPNRIAADYPDEAERYAVLTFLWDYLHEKAPDSPGAKVKRASYYDASTALRTKYVMAGDASSDQFENRTRQLSADHDFKRSVLEKYGLLNLAMTTATPQNRNADVTDAMIQAIFWKALPILVITFVLMFLITKMVVRYSVRSPTLDAPATVSAHALPPLPEALRVIKVPGLTYRVEAQSGLVVDKESAIHTRQVTTTTPAQAITVGNDIYITPQKITTQSTSTKVDTVWVRTPDRVATSWTFTGDQFKTAPGHMISAIARHVSGGGTEFLAAYNHTTGQFVPFAVNAHATRASKAWLLSTMVGSIGFAIWIGVILSIKPIEDPTDRLLSPIVFWMEGLIPAAFIAWIIVMRAQAKVMRQRDARFASQYLPGFQQFLAQATPAVQRIFNAP